MVVVGSEHKSKWDGRVVLTRFCGTEAEFSTPHEASKSPGSIYSGCKSKKYRGSERERRAKIKKKF